MASDLSSIFQDLRHRDLAIADSGDPFRGIVDENGSRKAEQMVRAGCRSASQVGLRLAIDAGNRL